MPRGTWEAGMEGWQGRIIKESDKTLGGDGYIHDLDCRDGFKTVFTG